MGQLLPILKPAGYRKDTPLFFKELLFDSADAPVIAFGTDEGRMIMYETATNEEDCQNRLPLLKQQALDNLKTVYPEMEIQDIQGTKIAFVIGHEYACEKILDKEFMIGVSKKLGAYSLMVGIPFKGHLIATDANSELRLKFPAVIKNYYANPQQDPISENVFLIENGEITAMAGEHISDNRVSNFNITEIGSTNNFEVTVSCKSIEELTEAVNNSFQQIMGMIMGRKSFGGQIAYHLDPSMPLTGQLVEKCNNYAAQIRENEMAQALVQSLTKSNIQLLFFYNGNAIAPQDVQKSDNSIEAPDPHSGNTKKWWQFWK